MDDEGKINNHLVKAEELIQLVREYPVPGSCQHLEELRTLIDNIESLLIKQGTMQGFEPEVISTGLVVRHLQLNTPLSSSHV